MTKILFYCFKILLLLILKKKTVFCKFCRFVEFYSEKVDYKPRAVEFKVRFTLSESVSKSDKHQRKFLLSLSSDVNEPLYVSLFQLK